jgi:tRNA A-37 threonylcarbamoyl transferase component Bud32
MLQPTSADIAAYRAGTLTLPRFEEVDAWLATLPADEQERLLGELELPPSLTPPELAGEIFTSESATSRFTPLHTLGAGGMGIVELVHDRVLDRQVALKRCRPRGLNEPIASHALRLRLFRREAAITARLEHPGIVPVHDVGAAAAGEPAYVMKRLRGTTLATRAPLPAAEAADILLKVADALGFAHHAGIVHRDLKPEHIWLGEDAETLVIDWGLAGSTGASLVTAEHVTGQKAHQTDLAGANQRLGTPPWAAPETSGAAPADPRMDVWALGALLRFALTGAAPDQPCALGRRGLGAIAAQCMAAAPAQRYADAAEVAADMRRWLRHGIALAEERSWGIHALLAGRRFLQRQPLLTAALLTALVAGLALSASLARERSLATQQALTLLGTPLPDADGLRQWREQLSALPETAAVGSARQRIERALADDHLRELARRYAHRGPWPGEISELTAALVAAGCDPLAPTAAVILREHPERGLLLAVAVQLQRALLVARVDSPLIAAIPRLIADAAPDAAWGSVADLLTRPLIGPHELELCQCDESEAALHQEDTANVLLATYAPDARLARLAEERLRTTPGAFWPRITAARAALIARHTAEVRTHALVALGADPLSMWPHILLAYAAMDAGDDATLASESAAGLQSNPEYLELQALHALALARSGHLDEAQTFIDGLHQAAHFQHHLHHRSGHPMERCVDALLAAGVRLGTSP